jgi:hypothetical protein
MFQLAPLRYGARSGHHAHMVSVKRALLPVVSCAVLVSCGDTSPPEPTAAAELRFSSPLLITKEADSAAKVFVADANDDSWLDVLTWGEGAPYANIAIPDQGLSQPIKVAGLPSGPVRQAAWLDLTGDRCADVLVLDDAGQLRRFHSESRDEYSEQSLQLPETGPIAAFAVLDVNRDERLDFVLLGERGEADAGNTAATLLYVLLGEEGGRWTLAHEQSFEGTEAASDQVTPFLQPTDVNGDERWDIVVGVPGIGVGWLSQLGPEAIEAGVTPHLGDAGADADAPEPDDARAELFRFIALAGPGGDATGVAFIDHDNDGDVDWFRFSSDADTQLFPNDGGGDFAPKNAATGLGAGGLGCVEDFDNDGLLDVLSVNDDITLRLGSSKYNKFTEGLELTPGSSLPISSLLCVDIDNDGDVDLLTGGSKGTGLYLNRLEPLQAEGRNYFDFRFAGSDGNSAALGTSLELAVGKRTLRREFVASGQAFLAATPSVHVGLGAAALLDSVKITWPNGESVEASDWTVNDTVTATQPE